MRKYWQRSCLCLATIRLGGPPKETETIEAGAEKILVVVGLGLYCTRLPSTPCHLTSFDQKSIDTDTLAVLPSSQQREF